MQKHRGEQVRARRGTSRLTHTSRVPHRLLQRTAGTRKTGMQELQFRSTTGTNLKSSSHVLDFRKITTSHPSVEAEMAHQTTKDRITTIRSIMPPGQRSCNEPLRKTEKASPLMSVSIQIYYRRHITQIWSTNSQTHSNVTSPNRCTLDLGLNPAVPAVT
jgi:hypothetical protein